jgi:Ferredoxin-dependent bilin reductase
MPFRSLTFLTLQAIPDQGHRSAKQRVYHRTHHLTHDGSSSTFSFSLDTQSDNINSYLKRQILILRHPFSHNFIPDFVATANMSPKNTCLLCILLAVAVSNSMPSSYAWSTKPMASSHQKVLQKSVVTMDSEGPTVLPVPSFLHDKWQRYRCEQQRSRSNGSFTSTVTSSVGQIPWIKDTKEDSSKDAVFLSHWNWQLEYFQKHLTNLRVNVAGTGDDDLMYVENSSSSSSKGGKTSPKQRIYTVSLESDEYRDIRMTYLHCDDQAQIFRCTCYPRNDMPILGMGLMQLGQHRNVAIIDFQPLLEEDDNDESLSEQCKYTSRLEEIRSSYKSMQQPMSDRHFDPNEQRYFTANPIIGKWIKDEECATQCWRDLQQVHQDCVQAHVELTQTSRAKAELSHHQVEQMHSDYDTFVASKEPASHLLGSAFGKDVALRLVHQVIFPLSQQKLR